MNKEIKRFSKIEKKKYSNILEIEEKKKVIEDFFNLPNIDENKEYIKNLIDEAMKKETYFKSKGEM